MTGHVKGRLQVKSNIQSRPSPIWPCPPLHSLKGMLSGSKDTGVLLFRSFIMLSHASVHLCCCLCVAFSPAKPAWQTPKTPSNLSSSIIFLWEAFDSSRKTRASFPLCFHWTPQLYKLGVWTLLVSKSVSKLGTSSSHRESDYLRMLLLQLRTQVQRVFTQVVNLLAHGPGSPVEQHGV